MANTMLEISRMGKLMAMVYFKISMAESMKENGRKTNNMESAKKSGIMVKRRTKESF